MKRMMLLPDYEDIFVVEVAGIGKVSIFDYKHCCLVDMKNEELEFDDLDEVLDYLNELGEVKFDIGSE